MCICVCLIPAQKTTRHGTVTVYTPSHMSELLAWYRLQSGDYSKAVTRGLVSQLDVSAPTQPREAYDEAWVVNASLRAREDGGGVEVQPEMEADAEEKEEKYVFIE